MNRAPSSDNCTFQYARVVLLIYNIIPKKHLQLFKIPAISLLVQCFLYYLQCLITSHDMHHLQFSYCWLKRLHHKACGYNVPFSYFPLLLNWTSTSFFAYLRSFSLDDKIILEINAKSQKYKPQTISLTSVYHFLTDFLMRQPTQMMQY